VAERRKIRAVHWSAGDSAVVSVLSRLCGLCSRRRRMSLGESGEQVRRGGKSLQENNFELEAKGERRLVVSDGSVR